MTIESPGGGDASVLQPNVPRSGYIHIPFCRHRCGYCNFSVVANRDDLMDRFLDALDRELATWQNPCLETIFIGGGTPTHLDDERLRALLDILNQRMNRANDCEVSVEANPEDIHEEKLACLVDGGVNRISLGVQSFDEQKIHALERGHDRYQAIRAIETAAAFLPNVSIDLIFGASGESLDTWRTDLQTALDLPIRHLSTYSLTIEKGTRFYSQHRRGEIIKVDEATDVAMYQSAQELTAQAGFRQYEVSSFASPGHRCRHNLAYWKGQDWFAAGPGAAAFVRGVRRVNHRSVTTYIKRMENQVSPISEQETLSPIQTAMELAAFGVRMMDGVDLSAIHSRTGVSVWDHCRDLIQQSIQEELVTMDGQRLRLTQRGILFADTVASRFLDEMP